MSLLGRKDSLKADDHTEGASLARPSKCHPDAHLLARRAEDASLCGAISQSGCG